MSLRHATRTMTGTPSRGAEVVVGYDADGRPRATVYPYGREHACYDEARVLQEMVADLQAAIVHLGRDTWREGCVLGTACHFDRIALCSCDCPEHDQRAKAAEACSRWNAHLLEDARG